MIQSFVDKRTPQVWQRHRTKLHPDTQRPARNELAIRQRRHPRRRAGLRRLQEQAVSTGGVEPTRKVWRDYAVAATDLDEATAQQVMAVLLGNPDQRECPCGCHPRMSTLHDGGIDCPCSWDPARRATERLRLTEFRATPEAEELRSQHTRDESAIAQWLTDQPDVEARRTTCYAPEQWEGSVDGHTFYFRERHGTWEIELDLQLTGRFVEKLTNVRADGEPVTEPVPITAGTVIADGVESQLGTSPVEHIAFIVRTIRDHLRSQACGHFGALFFCPKCGLRMDQLP